MLVGHRTIDVSMGGVESRGGDFGLVRLSRYNDLLNESQVVHGQEGMSALSGQTCTTLMRAASRLAVGKQ